MKRRAIAGVVPALILLPFIALAASALLLATKPGVLASPDATITVNSTGNTHSRDGVLTLAEAILLVTGGLAVGSLDSGECSQISNSTWGPPCSTADSVGPASADTIVFDPSVFPPGAPAAIDVSTWLPYLTASGDTISGGGAGVILACDDSMSSPCLGIYGEDADANTIKGLQFERRATPCVWISGGADNNVIGGGMAGEGNTFLGCWTGVQIDGSGSTGNVVKGNFIDMIWGAGYSGVVIMDSPDNVIGGTTSGERNVISGYANVGVTIRGAMATGNVIKGNYIGTNASGDVAVANGWGVWVLNSAQRNTIGGLAPGEANLIAFNYLEGVWVRGTATTGNTITGNSIHSNGGKGIDNEDGGNGELAPPIIDSVGGPVSGHTNPKCYPCTVEIFSDDEGEGRTYHSSTTTNDDATGTWVYAGDVTGPNVTATVTDASGNTSEFSAPVAYSPPVGGIAELPEAEATPLQAADSSGGNAGVLAGIVIAGVLFLGGATWYARRRWVR